MTRALTLAEIAALPAVTDLVTAGRALGLGRTKAYELARAGQFPCPVIRAGKTWLVPVAGLLATLGLPLPGAARPDDPQTVGHAGLRSQASTNIPPGPPSCQRSRTRRSAHHPALSRTS